MLDEITKKVSEVVQKMLELMGEEASVECNHREGSITVDVTVEEPAPLIGKGGKVLDDFQLLVYRVVKRTYADEKIPSIIIDVGGYRHKREEELSNMAKEIAERVSSNGKSVLLRPMSAWERRVVHVTVKGNGRICTESEDSKEGRRVRIKPKKG